MKASAQADKGASGPGIRPAGSGSVASLRPSFLSKKPHCPAEPNAVASCAPFCSLPPAVWIALKRNWVWKAASPADRRNSILNHEILKGSTHCRAERLSQLGHRHLLPEEELGLESSLSCRKQRTDSRSCITKNERSSYLGILCDRAACHMDGSAKERALKSGLFC